MYMLIFEEVIESLIKIRIRQQYSFSPFRDVQSCMAQSWSWDVEFCPSTSSMKTSFGKVFT